MLNMIADPKKEESYLRIEDLSRDRWTGCGLCELVGGANKIICVGGCRM